jgi:hypothetical protein
MVTVNDQNQGSRYLETEDMQPQFASKESLLMAHQSIITQPQLGMGQQVQSTNDIMQPTEDGRNILPEHMLKVNGQDGLRDPTLKL